MPPSSSRQFAEISTSLRPTDATVIMRRAVVLGGSMAGLLAARVLSDHADEVVIIERDGSEVGDEVRPGVPQGSQVHALLPAGQVQLERWFPGFTEEAVAAGAVLPRPERVQLHLNGARRHLPPPTGNPPLVTTRPFLEAMVRRRTMALDNIRFVHGRAEGLVFDGDRVVAARYLPMTGPDTPNAEPITEAADLVVDAMGRSSRLGDWLSENGWQRPPMRRMPIKLNYATALFARDEQVSDVDVVVSQTNAGNGRVARIGGINAVEGNRWIMLVAGYADDRPSRDTADFIARCRNDFPDAFGAIAEKGRMIGDVVTYHQADSRRRDFHELERLPAGLVVAGDAVASFNPVYGQGMTSATLHASGLSSYLRTNPDLQLPAREYFEKVRIVADAAWQVSTTADLGLPHVDGPYPPGYGFISWFGNRLLAATFSDPVLNQRLSAVTGMVAHPSSLVRPSTMVRTIRASLFSRAA